jgi:DNA-directed RNA polymerase I subunit RPA2
MAPSTSRRTGTNTKWTHEFDTIRRESLFRNPPKDHTAYPALQAAIAPHIESFNALFEKNGLIAQALLDIGTKTFLDGDERAGPAGKNRLDIRIKDVFLEKSMLPASNKFSTRNREILPAECRERHVTYRGKLSARLEYRINNGDSKEVIRELGQLPLMLLVGIPTHWENQIADPNASPIDAISKTIHPHYSYSGKKKRKNWADILL